MEGRENGFTELYKECQRNHAAKLGYVATDGCNEYIHDTTLPGMYCEACGCHRNFHHKVLLPVKKIERYQANTKQSDNGSKDSGLVSENRMNFDQGNKKECDRKTKEPIVQKGFEGNQVNQIQGGRLYKPEPACSPFMIFMNEFRELREKHAYNNRFCGVALAGGNKWRSMTDADKAPYVTMAEKGRAENMKYDELKNKHDESNSESKEEESNEDEESDEEDDDEDSNYEEEDDDEESDEEDDDEESYEEEDDDEESDEENDDEESYEEEDDDDQKSDEVYYDDEESNELHSGNANANNDKEEVVFVNSEPDVLNSPTSDPCEEDDGFELINADTDCGEQFKAPDLSYLISKLETSAITEDDEDVDETGFDSRDIELVMTQAGVSRSKAAKAMKAAEGDIVDAIFELTS